MTTPATRRSSATMQSTMERSLPGRPFSVRDLQEAVVPRSEAFGLTRAQIAVVLALTERELILAEPEALDIAIHECRRTCATTTAARRSVRSPVP